MLSTHATAAESSEDAKGSTDIYSLLRMVKPAGDFDAGVDSTGQVVMDSPAAC